MEFVNYISEISVPFVIVLVTIYGLKEKKKVYNLFIEGVKDGLKIVVNLFPTLLAIFVAVGIIRNSGIFEMFLGENGDLFQKLRFPKEILPLALIRPISGSAATGIAIDIMKTYGVDSKIGMIASTIIGATETTFYTIAVYTSSIKVKKTRFIVWAALIADFVGITSSIIICNIIFK